MTFQEYINNPLGRANAVISYREMYRNMYTEKLNTIMVRENGKIDYTLYETNNSYICHIKVPSEVVDKFYYDVVVLFKKEKGVRNLLNSEVKFYSNDPSFVFTFTHAFVKNKMFIEELSEKMSKRAIKEKADEKNPNDQVGYVKSLYFAYILMNQKGLFNSVKYEAEKKTFSDKILKSNIMHADEKIELRQEAQKKLDGEKSKAKNKETQSATKLTRRDIINPASSYISNGTRVSNITHTNTISATSKSKSANKSISIKKTKRI